jgi:hypothetical protein
MLADKGQKILTLSEKPEGSEEEKEVELSSTDIVERIIRSMPASEDGKLDFSDQALITDDHGKPDSEPKKSNAVELAEYWGIENYPTDKDGDE